MNQPNFIRRLSKADYIENQSVSIGAGGGSDTIENLPKNPDTALEFEIEGKRYVILAYERKS